jgi:hypothetical protein
VLHVRRSVVAVPGAVGPKITCAWVVFSIGFRDSEHVSQRKNV